MEISGDVTDAGRTKDERQTVKIELLSQWMLEAEFRNTTLNLYFTSVNCCAVHYIILNALYATDGTGPDAVRATAR